MKFFHWSSRPGAPPLVHVTSLQKKEAISFQKKKEAITYDDFRDTPLTLKNEIFARLS